MTSWWLFGIYVVLVGILFQIIELVEALRDIAGKL